MYPNHIWNQSISHSSLPKHTYKETFPYIHSKIVIEWHKEYPFMEHVRVLGVRRSYVLWLFALPVLAKLSLRLGISIGL